VLRQVEDRILDLAPVRRHLAEQEAGIQVATGAVVAGEVGVQPGHHLAGSAPEERGLDDEPPHAVAAVAVQLEQRRGWGVVQRALVRREGEGIEALAFRHATSPCSYSTPTRAERDQS